jgi:hypothetical protein
VRFGATIPFAKGFPKATIKAFDSCKGLTSMDAEGEEDIQAHQVPANKKLRGNAH